MLVSLTDLGKLTGLDSRRMGQKLCDLPWVPGQKNSKQYDSELALPLLYEAGPLDGQKERARLTHHQANIAELDEDVRRGVLVDRDAVVIEVSEAVANMRAKLLNLPHKVAPVIVAMDDLHEIKSALESVVHESLSELHNQYVSDGQDSPGIETPAPVKGESVGRRKQATVQ